MYMSVCKDSGNLQCLLPLLFFLPHPWKMSPFDGGFLPCKFRLGLRILVNMLFQVAALTRCELAYSRLP